MKVLEDPSAVYFLDVTPEEAADIQALGRHHCCHAGILTPAWSCYDAGNHGKLSVNEINPLKALGTRASVTSY